LTDASFDLTCFRVVIPFLSFLHLADEIVKGNIMTLLLFAELLKRSRYFCDAVGVRARPSLIPLGQWSQALV
jgi:hypothetical protein